MVNRSPRTMALLTLKERNVRFARSVAPIGEHDAQFGEPFALWTGVGDRMGGPATRAPAIVSYRADDFMDRLTRDLGDRAALATADEARKVRLGSDDPAKTQKLFLPFHGWFHVVTSSFLCRLPGFPDRDISAADKETLSFVIRRVRTPGSVQIEEAWVPADDSVNGSTGGWVSAGTHAESVPVDGEERLPLARLAMLGDRVVCTGYLPVATRDHYTGRVDDPWSSVADAHVAFAPLIEKLQELQHKHGRLESAKQLLRLHDYFRDTLRQVGKKLNGTNIALSPEGELLVTWLQAPSSFAPLAGTWAQALASADANRSAITQASADPGPLSFDLTRLSAARLTDLAARIGRAATDEWTHSHSNGVAGGSENSMMHVVTLPPAPDLVAPVKNIRDTRCDLSCHVIDDLTDFLAKYAPELATAVRGSATAADATYHGDSGNDPHPLDAQGIDPQSRLAPIAAAMAALTVRADFGDASAQVSSFYAALKGRAAAVAASKAEVPVPLTNPYDLTETDATAFTALRPAIESVLSGALLPKYPYAADADGPFFVVRCLYERACCKPARLLLSDPSAPWIPAPVFDPEAPARQMRVPLPMSLRPSDLGKPKGLGFIMSPEFRKKLATINKSLITPSPVPGAEPTIDIGAICTLSIPIVTICAFILLTIVVNILNIVFKWLPYFVVCYPTVAAPKPSAKA